MNKYAALLFSIFLILSCSDDTQPAAPIVNTDTTKTDSIIVDKDPTVDTTETDTLLPVDSSTAVNITDMELYEEVFNDEVFHEYIVEISQEEWDGITQDMLDYAEEHPLMYSSEGSGEKYRTANYRRAKFTYKSSKGDIVIDSIGIRTRGNYTRTLPQVGDDFNKAHFKIKFDKKFDEVEGTPEYEARDERRFGEMRALNFRWAMSDRSKIIENFSYELLEKAGVTVPKVSQSTLKFFIDGKEVNYGLYGVVEHLDKSFLKKRYGSEGNDGNLYKCLYMSLPAMLTHKTITSSSVGIKDPDINYRPTYDLKTNKSTPDHTQFLSFVDSINILEADGFVSYIEKNFEVDKFIRTLAMSIYISNVDDYRFDGNNYYLYFNNIGKIEFIPYDYDIALSNGWDGEIGYDGIIDQDIYKTTNIPGIWGEPADRPLVDKVLSIDKYKVLYEKYLKEFVDAESGLFLFSEFQKKFDSYSSLYSTEIENDTDDREIIAISTSQDRFFSDKTANVLEQLDSLQAN